MFLLLLQLVVVVPIVMSGRVIVPVVVGRGRTVDAFSSLEVLRRRRRPFIASNGRASVTSLVFSTNSCSSSRHAHQNNRNRHTKFRLKSRNEYDDESFYYSTQVISDVDDTLKSSGGVNVGGVALGGIDVQYARGTHYPGVTEFMLHLSVGPMSLSSTHGESPLVPTTRTPAKIAILTARAEEFKLALELKPDNPLSVAFQRAGQEFLNMDDWGIGPVLYGSVAEWIVQDRKGLRKFNNFERLIQQDPTSSYMRYVYVGDTGELDQQAGETMVREYPQLVMAVFLHVVSGIRQREVAVPPVKFINGRPIVFFRTYVGAAVAAVQLGLMCPVGLERVIQAACAQLQDEPKNSDKWMDLERDIASANPIFKN